MLDWLAVGSAKGCLLSPSFQMLTAKISQPLRLFCVWNRDWGATGMKQWDLRRWLGNVLGDQA